MSIVRPCQPRWECRSGSVRETRPGELLLEDDHVRVAGIRRPRDRGLSGRLLSLFASDERDTNGRFLLHHLWFLPNLRSFLQIVAPVLPS